MIQTRPLVLLLLAAGLLASAATARAADPRALPVLGPDYPRAFFFRASESAGRGRWTSYDDWDANFSRLMGIEGKTLEEEIPGRSMPNIEYFTRFKRAHPDQLVLLHYNGNARDPRFQIDEFFAGHWLYANGSKILEDLPASADAVEIRVANPALYRTEIGRYRNSNDDIGLCALDASGRPDWTQSEQVQLVSVDARRGILRVRRGCYGTEPRAFAAGKAYAAAHLTEGPWGAQSNLLWYYNYATACPRDAQGRTCADVHAEDLARRFAAGGELAAFDGLEFDVLHNEAGGRGPGFGADCDADGQIDYGVIDGRNAYGIGVVEFCSKLRSLMGENRLILADGMTHRSQRAFAALNGIESEGWPWLGDWEIRDWSGGLNRHNYWRDHARPPVFNYINHKFVTHGEMPGVTTTPDVPMSVHRLVLAVAQFTDSAVCYSFAPPAEPGESYGIWDELRKGAEHELGWLGAAEGPAVHLAEQTPDLLQGQAAPPAAAFLERLDAGDGHIALADGALKLSGAEDDSETRLRIRNVPCQGPDLVIALTARGEPMKGYPAEYARLAWLGIGAAEGELISQKLPEAAMRIRDGAETALDPASGATVSYRADVALSGETRSAYMVHPPYKNGVGYTVWHRDLTVPQGGRLELFTGMGEKSPERSDGVWFSVEAANLSAGAPGEFRTIFKRTQKESRWIPHEISLADWAGKRVRLRFISDCGPRDNSTTDQSYWADVRVLGPGGAATVTPPAEFMTFTGERSFTSYFYFADVRSSTVDLELRVEGTERVTIESLRAYAAPDTIVRRFTRGLVLANPAPRPRKLNLAEIDPGATFRRLRGSSRQDPQTNSGAAVGPHVTLGPKEGLFLVKVE